MTGISVPKFQTHRKVVVFALAVLLVCCFGASSSFAQDAEPRVYQAAGLHPFGDEAMALPGAATLTTSANEATVTLHSTSLDPNALYTVWAVAFNSPENCTAGNDPRPTVKCGSGDLSATPNMAEASAFILGGVIADATGGANFTGTIRSGPLSEGTFVLWGADGLNDNGVTPGLKADNGLMVELHFIFRTHGAVIPEMSAEQISTLSGGCPPNECVNQQAASFPPASSLGGN